MKIHQTGTRFCRSEGPEDFRKCDDQWWQHAPGTEWLIANPVEISVLKTIFELAVRDNAVHPDANAFGYHDTAGFISNPTDPFLQLPTEISHLLISYLSNKDVANLRLVSRQYGQLPQSFFHTRLRADMPWLTEMWDHTPRSKWCFLTRQELEEHDEADEALERELEHYRTVIEEAEPQMLADWIVAGNKVKIERLQQRQNDLKERVDKASLMLPRERTDWYMLYSEIVKRWRDLKGLRNRERLWGELEKLMLDMKQLG